jgi:FHS family L-fucose permease-like MFS transporter
MKENLNYVKKSRQANWITIGTIGVFFFIFGFITWLNGILIPYLRISCKPNHFESYRQ